MLADALGAIRKGKTDQKVSVGTEVVTVAYARSAMTRSARCAWSSAT